MLPQKTLTKELIVPNRSGLHARVSTMIVQTCKKFASDIRLRNGGGIADCRSVLDILSLGASKGTVVLLEATGSDAEEAIATIVALFDARFNEDDESQ
jgi:phosphotransferase system HPr (HPr) family protein